MLDKELFFSLCEKYNVELSDKYGKSMIKFGDNVRPISKEDVKNIIPKYQVYFLYDSLGMKYKKNTSTSYNMSNDFSIAC